MSATPGHWPSSVSYETTSRGVRLEVSVGPRGTLLEVHCFCGWSAVLGADGVDDVQAAADEHFGVGWLDWS